MMKNFKICRIVLLCLFALSIGCSKDDYQLEQQQRSEPRSKVSFEQFKNETGLKDFKTSIQVQPQKNGALNRNADGSYELSDFDIDIDVIKKMELKQDVSYTFQVHPKGESTDKIHNLVMYYRDGKWQTTIVELQPTKKTLDALKLGQKDIFEGDIAVVYDSASLSRSGDCIAFIVDTSNHCPRKGVCDPTCDGCSYCVRTTTTLFCFGGGSMAEVFESMQDIPNPHVSGGGSDEPPTTDPNTPTDTDPTLTTPPKKPILIDPVITVNNEALLNATFISGLLAPQQNWLNAHSDIKASILEYLRLNLHSVDSDLFAKEAIDVLKNGGEVDFPNNIIYTINKPAQKQLVKDVLNVCSPFTELIQQTFNSTDKVNLKFYNGLIPGANAFTSPQYLGNSDNFLIKIKLDDGLLNNGTNLSIVAVTLHELVHAYLMNLYIKGNLVTTDSNYSTLLDAFINYYNNQVPDTFDPLDNEIHNAMKNFINKMANSIYNYALLKNIPNITPAFCEQLAWGTMVGTNLFQTVLTSQQQMDYENIFAIEQDNLPGAKGTLCN